MQMSNGEIAREYCSAKNHRAQIGVLAELNECSKADIIRIIADQGIDLPDYPEVRNALNVKPECEEPEKEDAKPDAFEFQSEKETELMEKIGKCYAKIEELENKARSLADVTECLRQKTKDLMQEVARLRLKNRTLEIVNEAYEERIVDYMISDGGEE